VRSRALRSVLAAALLASACPKPDPADGTPAIRIDARRYRVSLRDDDYAQGGATPLVTIVVFSDYACPPCARLWTVMDRLVEDYGEDLRVVWRGYSVAGFARGEQGVEAALAAGAQGKFWEMHRRLFEHTGELERPMLRAHAEALGLDTARFVDDLDTGAYASRRIQDRRQGTALGVVGVPASFVNGLYVPGYADEATWHGIVDGEIARARKLVDEGTPRAELYATLMASASTERVDAPPDAAALRKQIEERKPSAREIVAPRADARYAVVPGELPPLGPDDALVTIVEFVDFECPFCKKAWDGELESILREHAADVRLALRHMPLEIHPSARGAAQAAAAAARQGKLRELHARLFAHEGTLGQSDFLAWARELGLDVDRFARDLEDPAIAAAIEADTRLAARLGVTGTPGFFVNGRYVRGYEPGQLRGVVAEELAHARTLLAQGTARRELFARIMKDAIGEEGFPNP
jgi:protein-disulfide isomerase